MWEETTKMRERNRENLGKVKNTFNLNVEEDGADIIFHKNHLTDF